MEIVSFVVLILLSLVAYCAGAAGKAGKSTVLKPRVVDLILVLAIWTAAICSRLTLDLNKWLLILVWVILGSLVGILATWPRESSQETASGEEGVIDKGPRETSRNLLKKLWARWQDFWNRVGSFQSRIVLSLLFFILVSPFALGVKAFSDPLRIKHQSNESHWLARMESEVDLEQFKGQF